MHTVSQAVSEWGWRKRCVTCESVCGVNESLSLGLGHMLFFNLGMRVCSSIFVLLSFYLCSSITLSVLLEKSPFNITHSRSEIEWSSLLMCLVTGSAFLLSVILFCDCSCRVLSR